MGSAAARGHHETRALTRLHSAGPGRPTRSTRSRRGWQRARRDGRRVPQAWREVPPGDANRRHLPCVTTARRLRLESIRSRGGRGEEADEDERPAVLLGDREPPCLLNEGSKRAFETASASSQKGALSTARTGPSPSPGRACSSSWPSRYVPPGSGINSAPCVVGGDAAVTSAAEPGAVPVTGDAGQAHKPACPRA